MGTEFSVPIFFFVIGFSSFFLEGFLFSNFFFPSCLFL